MTSGAGDDDLVEVVVRVPRAPLARMSELAEASGVTIDAFVSASLEMRAAQHEGRTTLLPELEAASRRHMG